MGSGPSSNTWPWCPPQRAQWYSVKSELERELEAEELKRSMQETQAALKQAQTRLQDEFGQAQAHVQERLHATGRELDAVRREVEGGPSVAGPETPPLQGPDDESRRP